MKLLIGINFEPLKMEDSLQSNNDYDSSEAVLVKHIIDLTVSVLLSNLLCAC